MIATEVGTEAEVVLETPAVLNDTQARLLDAERYIAEHGWAPQMYGPRGEACVLVAYVRANGKLASSVDRGMECMYAALPPGHGSIGRWNDRFCSSQEEAIALLRRAREIAADDTRST